MMMLVSFLRNASDVQWFTIPRHPVIPSDSKTSKKHRHLILIDMHGKEVYLKLPCLLFFLEIAVVFV